MFSGGLSKQCGRDQEQYYTEDNDSSLDSGVVVLPDVNPYAEEPNPASCSQATSHAPRHSSGRVANRRRDEDEPGVTVLSMENPFAERDQGRGGGRRDRSPEPAPQSRKTRSYLFSDSSSEDATQGRASGHRPARQHDWSPPPPPRTRTRNSQPQQVASTSRGNARYGSNFIRPVELEVDIGNGNETDPLVVQWVDDPAQSDQDQDEDRGRRTPVQGPSGQRDHERRDGGHRPVDDHSTVDTHCTTEGSSSSSSSASSSSEEPAPAPPVARPSPHPDRRPSGAQPARRSNSAQRPSVSRPVTHPSADERPSVIRTGRPSIRFNESVASRPALAPRQRASSADRGQVRPKHFGELGSSDSSSSEDSLADTRHRHERGHHHHRHHDHGRHHHRHHHHRRHTPVDWSDSEDFPHHHRPHHDPYRRHHSHSRERLYHGDHHHGGHHHHHGEHHHEGYWHPRHYPPPMPLEWMEHYAPHLPHPPRSCGPHPDLFEAQRFSNIPAFPSLLDQCKAPYHVLALPPDSVLNDVRSRFQGPATSEPVPPLPPRPEPEDSQEFDNGYKLLAGETKDTLKFLQLVEYQELHPYYSDQVYQRLSSIVKVRFGERDGKELVNRVHVVPRGRLALGTVMLARPKLDIDIVIPGDYVLRRWSISLGESDALRPMTAASALGLDSVSIARGEIDGGRLGWVLQAVWDQLQGEADGFIFPDGHTDALKVLPKEWCILHKPVEGGNRLRVEVLEKDPIFVNLFVKVAVTLNGQQMVVGVDQTSAKSGGRYQMIKTLRAPGTSLSEAPLSPIDRSAIITLNWWQISTKRALEAEKNDADAVTPKLRTSHFLIALSALHSLSPTHDLYVPRATTSTLPFSLARMLDTMYKILEYLQRAYKPPEVMISGQPTGEGAATVQYAFPLSSCTKIDALYTQAIANTAEFEALQQSGLLANLSGKIKDTLKALEDSGFLPGEFTLGEK